MSIVIFWQWNLFKVWPFLPSWQNNWYFWVLRFKTNKQKLHNSFSEESGFTSKGFTSPCPPTPPYTRLGAEIAGSQLWRQLGLKSLPSTLQAALFLRRPVLWAWGPPCRGCPGLRPPYGRWAGVRVAVEGRGGGDLNTPFSARFRDSAVLLSGPSLPPSFILWSGLLGLMLRCFSSIFRIFALVYILNIWVSLGFNKTVKRPWLFW